MKAVLGLDNVAYAILVFVVLAKFSEAGRLKVKELDHDKNRRGANMGLYAFPRVGRSDPSLANGVHDAGESSAFESTYGDSSQEDYEDYQKRASLVPFPRVGRQDPELRKLARLVARQQAYDKRTGPNASSGLWFGPRLGKRSVDAKDYPVAADKGQKEFN
ncbi:cardio acceleratory peptide 2b isoform X1 [Drosophila willistoni]|uniref:cardio acceleratory peptide 2b isoform X1 n=1 Tax=Drosophila willistoni TaxID=7260 RepID=UPI000C26D67F|nr:cardio acceleratory peptide 2b isoform X1 [Drosophila willistoni]